MQVCVMTSIDSHSFSIKVLFTCRTICLKLQTIIRLVLITFITHHCVGTYVFAAHLLDQCAYVHWFMPLQITHLAGFTYQFKCSLKCASKILFFIISGRTNCRIYSALFTCCMFMDDVLECSC